MHPGDGTAEDNAEEHPHIDDHKTEQLRLTGAVIFAINFFGDAVGMFQPRMVGAQKHNKTHH
ncbi:Uncharacterised protein [Raoultella ornithinolytica]|nr:Uncharacterised protein [Raoultella ornithinolytica]